MADRLPTADEPAVEPAVEPADGPASVGGSASVGGAEPTASVRQASETWESLFRAQVGIMQRIRQDPSFKDLPIREYDVLFNLSRCPTGWTRLNELNHHLLISQPSLSRMVDRLEARNLVRRRPAATDHRGIELALTEEGRALQRRIGSDHVQRIREVLAPVLDPGEMDQLKALTDKINARLGA